MVALRSQDMDRFLARYTGGGSAFLIFGADQGLIGEQIRLAIRACVADPNDPFQLVRLDGDAIPDNPGLLADEWNSMGLFHARRAILIELGSKDILEPLQICLDKPNPDCSIIVRGGVLRRDSAIRQFCERHKQGLAVECFADSERDIRMLVESVLSEAGLTLDSAAMELLLSGLGGDRAMTRGELEKLVLYAGEPGALEAADIEAIIADVAPRAGEPAIISAFMGATDKATVEALRALEGASAGALAGAFLRFALLGHRICAESGGGQASEAAIAKFGGAMGPLRKHLPAMLKGKTASDMLSIVNIAHDAVGRGRREPALDEAITVRALWSASQRSRPRR